MKNQHHIHTIEQAIKRYLEVVGEGADMPSAPLCTAHPKGQFILENVNGLLAVVTSNGKVLDRIGGVRLDDSDVGVDAERCGAKTIDDAWMRRLDAVTKVQTEGGFK